MSISLMIWALVLTRSGLDQDHTAQAKPQGEGPASVHNGTFPNAVFDAQGSLLVVFVKGDHVYVSRSDDRGQSFEPPAVVNRHPLALAVSGENRPVIAVDGARVYVVYTEALPGRYASRLMFARSLDGGESFDPPRQVNDDQVPTGHAYPAMAQTADGGLVLTWLDGRDRSEADAIAASSIYATRSNDGGTSFAPNRRWVQGVCTCCRLAMALDQEQRPHLVWRHIFAGQIRDHAIGQLSHDGSFQQERLAFDEWRIEGCPHQGPALAIDHLDRRHAAWFTIRDNRGELRYARQDAPASKAASRLLDGQNGMHPTLLVQGQTLLVAWIRGGEQGTQLLLQRSPDLGEHFEEARVLAQATGPADHPKLLIHGGQAYISWQTEAGFQLLTINN